MRQAFRRQVTRAAIRARAAWLHYELQRRLTRYQSDQLALARRYQVEDRQPERYGESTRQRILALAQAAQEPWEFVRTSGTMQAPKELFYPRSRARFLHRMYLKQVLLACDAVGIDRLAGYFVTSLAPDHSLSGLLARTRPPWLLEKIALGESLPHLPQVAALVGRFSQDAIHVMLLTLTAPVIVATVNPSSLSVLLDRVARDWDHIRHDVRGALSTDLLPAVLRRLQASARLRETRLRAFASRPRGPTPQELLPELRAIYCWNGGYVQPFVDRLREQLADLQPTFFSMFSLSTETVAYEIFPRITTLGGFPIYPGVCYEFLPQHTAATAEHVGKPWDLEVGKPYEMLVSDPYGLIRYRTEDIFECLGFEHQTPLLRFLGRAGLTYSFTGEKIIAEQLLEAYERVRRDLRLDGAVFTCFPNRNRGRIPGYVFVCCPATDSGLPGALSAEVFDRHLIEINSEYAVKRQSGRLAPPDLVVESYPSLIAKLMNSDRRYDGTNPQQFKLLPLHQMFWDQLPPAPTLS